MKISKKLPLLIICISLVPILLVAIVCFSIISQGSMTTYKGILNSATSSISRQFDDFYQSQINNIKYYKSIHTFGEFAVDPVNKEKYKEARDLLDMGSSTDSNIYNTMLLDMQGNVICSVDDKYENTNVSNETFYKGLINKDTVDGVNIGVTNDNENTYISFSTYIKYDMENVGIICNIINLDYINSNVENTQIGITGYIYVIDKDGVVISNRFKERVGLLSEDDKNIVQLVNLAKDFKNGTLKSNYGYIEYKRDDLEILGRYQKTGISKLIVVSAITTEEILYQAYQITSYILIFALITIILSMFLGLRVAYEIIGSLGYMSEKIRAIAQGDLKARCNYYRNDEVKLLCEDINIMAESMENANNKLVHLALIDALTKINNRKAIYDIMDEQYEGKKQAVMLLDLNGFKSINDNLGHDYGDIALKKVANVLKACQNSKVDVARLGGDEFLIFVNYYENEDEVFALAENVYNNVKAIKILDDKPVSLSASIGVAFKHEADNEKSSLIKKADSAMYINKKADDDKKFVVYDKD